MKKLRDRPTEVALETRRSLRRDFALARSGQSESIRNAIRGRLAATTRLSDGNPGVGVNVLQADWPDGRQSAIALTGVSISSAASVGLPRV